MNYEFNFSEFTVGDYAGFIEAAKANDVGAVAAIIQRCTNAPVLDLPMTEWYTLTNQFALAMQEEFLPLLRKVE